MYDEEKLKEILTSNGLVITKKGNVRLYDFVENVIGSRNPKMYIQKLSEPLNKKYITLSNCVKLLRKSRFKYCKEVCEYIDVKENLNSMIDVENRKFQFEGTEFTSFFICNDNNEWDVWVKGSEVARYLEYIDTAKAISEHVDKENELTFAQIQEYLGLDENEGPKNIQKTTIFINISGFFNLISHSKKPMAKKIRKWIENEVLPSLVKYGTYTMQPDKLEIESFYDDVAISQFNNKAVIYIAYIGKHNGEHLFKYGLTRDIFSRDYKQHRKSFTEFKIVFIGECDNCTEVEKLFEHELKVRYLHRSMTIKDKSQTELFTITTKITHMFLIELVQQLIIDNPLAAIKNAEEHNKQLINSLAIYKKNEEIHKLEKELHKLKQKYKLSDNYKLNIEKEIRIKESEDKKQARIKESEDKKQIRLKELDDETKIRLHEIDLEIEKEQKIQIAIENGIDLTTLVLDTNRPVNKRKKLEVIRL